MTASLPGTLSCSEAESPPGASAGSGGISTGTGGANPGAGGSVGAGGDAVGGGSGGGDGGTGAGSVTGVGGSVAMADCQFEITHSLSDVIGTVGIVEFSVDLPAVESASIDFGLDTAYGMTAPVDLSEPMYRTLLLGMKTDSEYHFRVTASAGGEQCQSEDYTLTTAPRPEEVVMPQIATHLPEQKAEGFMITSRWGENNGGPAFILDSDNELVWWYFAPIDVMRVRMSYDGKYLWMRNTAQLDGTGSVLRLSLDGLSEDVWELPRTTHDLAVLPDGKVGLIEHTDGCDRIIEFDPETGTTTPIFDVEQAHGSTECHVNYLAYSGIDDSYYISDFFVSDYIKISRAGELKWVLNGQGSTITGASWENQHGIHVLSPEHFLIFSNGGTNQSSAVLEYQMEGTSVTEIWRYEPDIQARFGGDVQRLDNGNTLISFSSASIIHEVNPAGELVEEFKFPTDHTVSYLMKRKSLYGGPPPKVDGL